MVLRLLSIVLLLWLATPVDEGQARLTLGAAPEATPGLASVEQAERLAAAFAKALGEDVELRVFNTREDVDQWLLKFTMLDLGLYDAAFLAERPGKYLVIGSVDGAGKLFVTSRQGVGGDLPQRIAKALQQTPVLAKGSVPAKTGKKPASAKMAKAGNAAPAAPVQPPVTPPSVQPQPVPPPVPVEPKVEPAKPEPPVMAPPPSVPALAAKPVSPAENVEGKTPRPLSPPEQIASIAAPKPLEKPQAPPAVPSAPEPARQEVAVVQPPAKAVPAPAEPKPKESPPAPPTAPAAPEPVHERVTAAQPPVKPSAAPTETKPVLPPQAPVTARSYRGEPPPVTPPPPLVFPALPAALETPLAPPTDVGQPVAIAKQPAPVAVAPGVRSAPPAPAKPSIAEGSTQPAQRIKPVAPAAPTPVQTTETPAVPGQKVPTAEPAKPEARPEPAAPAAASPAPPAAQVQTAQETPVPVAVETPVKTIAVSRLEPAGVTATPPASAPTTAEPAAEGPVPSVIAQPDIPQELRPPGVPAVRPTRLPAAPPPKEDEKVLTAKLPGKIGRTQKKEPLLPPPDPEPGIVYVVPFITLMVPDAVRERIFDQFVDKLNETGANRKLRFVILKEPLEKIDREWLDARKYVYGEVFGYVEDSGCCSTDLRAKARLTYYRAHHPEPTLRYEFPIRTFFEHNQTSIDVERTRLADQIANALVAELTKALQQ